MLDMWSNLQKHNKGKTKDLEQKSRVIFGNAKSLKALPMILRAYKNR
jgi:hypothetical protein